jgi:hypothetical protein
MSFRTNLRPRPRAPAGNTEGATSEEHRAGVRAEAEGMGGLVREIRGDVLEKGDARKLDKICRAWSHLALDPPDAECNKDEIRTFHIERDRRYVTAVSGGPIEAIREPNGVQYLQVVHETARDFLMRRVVHVRLGLELSSDFTVISHGVIFEACRRFILCPEFRYCLRPAFAKAIFNNTPLEIDWGWLWTRHPFTQYAVQYLLDHEEAHAFRQSPNAEQAFKLKRLYRRWLTVSGNIDPEKLTATDAEILKRQLPRFQ